MRKPKQAAGNWLPALLLLLGCPLSLEAQSASSSWPPLVSGEKLTFNLIWPSGISLGEATLTAARAGAEIHLEASVVADLPQYHAGYTFTSVADDRLCSLRFRETLREGRNTRETLYEFDQTKHTVRRTKNGQTTENAVPDCARDPLALLYHFRQQLASRQVPIGTAEATGAFYLGEDYVARYEAVTPEAVKLGSKSWEGDRFMIRVQGSDGERSFEIWIRPEPSRAPVAVRVQFSLGTLSAELQ